MQRYLANDYANVRGIAELGLPFNFLVGGRGTGKTYGALLYAIEDNIPNIFMRRTQTQVDMIMLPEYSPYKTLADDLELEVVTKKLTKNSSVVLIDEQEFSTILALSTVSNIRGFDASDKQLLIYDEFIPEPHERAIKQEGGAFKHAYETINRNRELKGKNPVQVLALANANDIANPIFIEFGLVTVAEKMKRRGQMEMIDRRKGIGIFFFDDSRISKQKEQTALYRANPDSEFNKLALGNDFSNNSPLNSSPRPLKEYNPLVEVGEITVYEHKSNGRFYISSHKFGTPPYFGMWPNEVKRFRKTFGWLWYEYLDSNIDFETATCEILFSKIFD